MRETIRNGMTAHSQQVVLERTYRATVQELWDLWTTREGFESWWAPAGCRAHVRTLEANGLIRTTKSGRVRTCVLDRERLALVEDWLAEQRRVWAARTDRLEQFVTDRTEGEQ